MKNINGCIVTKFGFLLFPNSAPQDSSMPDLDDGKGDVHTTHDEKENDSSSSSSNGEDESASTNHGAAFIPSLGIVIQSSVIRGMLLIFSSW